MPRLFPPPFVITENSNKRTQTKGLRNRIFIAAFSHNMHRLVDTKVTIGSADILPSPEIKNLGIIFDSKRTMSSHVTALCCSLNFS